MKLLLGYFGAEITENKQDNFPLWTQFLFKILCITVEDAYNVQSYTILQITQQHLMTVHFKPELTSL